jgi:hypothetical protein
MLALLSQVKTPTPIVSTADPFAADKARLAASKQTIEDLLVKVQNTKKIPDDEPVQKTVMRYTEEYLNYRTGERGYIAMAEGGIVNRPTMAMIGEAGAEAVIPLDRMGSMGTRVTVNVAGSVISEGQLQSVIQDVLYNLNRTGAVTQLSNLGR